MLASVLGWARWRDTRAGLAAALLGAGVATTALIKVNLGLYAGLPALLLRMPQRIGRWCLIGLMLALPLALTQAHGAAPWRIGLCAASMAACGGLLLLPAPAPGNRALRWAAIDARGVSPAPGADPAERERLRGLGYIGGEDEPVRRGPGERGGRGERGGPGGPGGAADWMHTNGIDHDPVRDLIVLSLRNRDEIWVIDHSATTEEARGSKGGRHGKGGDLLMRWGNPQAYGAGEAKDQRLAGQHDAQFIPQGHPGAGNILVFNNGGKDGSSEVLEIPVLLNDFAKLREVQPVWSFGSRQIHSGHISGTQRLPNGNTLVASGESGLLLEVNAKGESVWEWHSTEKGELAPAPGGRRGGPGGPPPGAAPGGRRGSGPGGPAGGSEYSLFRAERYALDFPGVARLMPAASAK
jgi:hypothetical protein